MDLFILRSGPAGVNIIGDYMDCNLANPSTTELVEMSHTEPVEGIDGIEPSEAEREEDAESQRLVREVTFIVETRRKKRREKEIRCALESTRSLSTKVQNKMLGVLLEGGWGRLAHCVTRHFKAPTLYGHKLIDIALITTIYDRTVACVEPLSSAAVSIADFQEETGMDESNIRKALSHLVEKGVLLKQRATKTVVFWGLNPYFFTSATPVNLPRGNVTQGKPPRGISPRTENGNSPRVKGWRITMGQSDQTTGNQKEIPSAKNLFQESAKESLSVSGDFPEDMQRRWARFKATGQGARVGREREIFERMFIQHKETFFRLCGSVVASLEKYGSGVPGRESKIHCPMSWIEGHWESNLARYRQRKAHEEELNEAHLRKIDREAKNAAQKREAELLKAKQDKEDACWKELIDAACLRFLERYSTEEDVVNFAREAIDLSANDYIRHCFEENGWEHKGVRSCVIEHFMKVESGEITTGVCPADQEESV